MSPDLAMISDGKKFMWDGQLYDNQEEAARAAESYKNENFEIQMVDEDGKFLEDRQGMGSHYAVAALSVEVANGSRHIAGSKRSNTAGRHSAVWKIRPHGLLSVRKLHHLL
jgi:hypothetical protein